MVNTRHYGEQKAEIVVGFSLAALSQTSAFIFIDELGWYHALASLMVLFY